MGAYRLVCFWLFIIIGVQLSDGGQTCLSCNHVVQPRDCFKLTICGQHEQCYMKRYVTAAGKIWYDIGCLDTSRCSALPNAPKPGGFAVTMPPSIIGKRKSNLNVTWSKYWTPPPSIIGRRQSQNGDQVLCEHCCNTTICNSGGYCKAQPLENPGPVCYSCKEAQTADGCDQITQCGEDEKCFIGQEINPISQAFRWTHGCKSNITCPVKDRKRQVVDGKVCDDCCDHDLCNNVCTNYIDWNAPVTTLPVNSTDSPVTEVIIVSTATSTTTAKTTSALSPTEQTSKSTTTQQTTVAPTTAMASTTRVLTTVTLTTQVPTTVTHTTQAPSTVPHTTQDPVRMIDCDFETGLCFWHQDKTDDGDWKLHSGSTATAHTGPKNDHTYGTGQGHYIYLEASNLIYQNVVRLESSPVFWKKGTCLSFWYHMHGSFIASLNVYVKEGNGSQLKLWSQSNEQGENWLPAKVLLPETSGTIVIEGYRGADIHGDIAVDDIKLIENCHI